MSRLGSGDATRGPRRAGRGLARIRSPAPSSLTGCWPSVFARSRGSEPQQRGARQRLARLADRLASEGGGQPAAGGPTCQRVARRHGRRRGGRGRPSGPCSPSGPVFQPAPAPAPGVQAALAQADDPGRGDPRRRCHPGGPGRHPVLPEGLSDRPGRSPTVAASCRRTPSSATSSPVTLAIRPGRTCRSSGPARTWADAEIVAAGEGDHRRPGRHRSSCRTCPSMPTGSEALGTMSTPGEDARVVGFAIRESSRCCAMTHAGMQSPWYHTLLQGIEELRGRPVSLRITRWDVPAGADLPPLQDGTLALRAVDVGTISGTVVPTRRSVRAAEPRALTFGCGQHHPAPQDARGRRHGAAVQRRSGGRGRLPADGRGRPDRRHDSRPGSGRGHGERADARSARRPQRHRARQRPRAAGRRRPRRGRGLRPGQWDLRASRRDEQHPQRHDHAAGGQPGPAGRRRRRTGRGLRPATERRGPGRSDGRGAALRLGDPPHGRPRARDRRRDGFSRDLRSRDRHVHADRFDEHRTSQTRLRAAARRPRPRGRR